VRAHLSYLSLLAERSGSGLLEPFQCTRCGRLHLDLGGITTENRPLCVWCADPATCPEPAERRPNTTSLREGTIDELRRFAVARKIRVEALELAQRTGTARIGFVCGFLSIVLLDQSGRTAEARRLDGKPFPPFMGKDFELGERKAHTIRHSQKNWPVGILPAPDYRDEVNILALVEGGPDFFAAHHFALLQKRTDIQPVAVLGRGQAKRGFHPDSLELFCGRRIRIFPHVDDDGGGLDQAIVWARQLEALGCEADLFRLDGLKRADGSPIKDLNDCVEITPSQAHELGELFP
jgi:hypothetical protein